jgi:hypothetical protein
MALTILGVHPVAGHRQLFLLEAELDPAAPFSWDEVTQETAGQPRENWQVPYDEQPLDGDRKWAFFFHFLDLEQPLLTPAGPVPLPAPTPLPDRLRAIEYEPP